MRILHLVRSDGFAGVERYLVYTATEQARRGHEVAVVGGDPDRMTDEFAGTTVEHAPAARTLDITRAAIEARRHRPDVVHTHMTAAEVGAVLAWPALRRPLVTTLHFARPRGGTRLLQSLMSPLRFAFAAQIGISSFVARGCGTPTTTIPSGIPSSRAGVRQRQPVVLMAQRLEPEKRTDVALESWALAGLAADGWYLSIAGTGSARGRLMGLAATLGIEASVELLGHMPDVGVLMAESSIFLAPADGEGFGLAVVEAMAAGLPVVASDSGFHPELLSGTGAPMFRSGDPRECADSLRKLAHHGPLRDQIGEAEQKRFEKLYTIEGHVDALLGLYHKITGIPVTTNGHL